MVFCLTCFICCYSTFSQAEVFPPSQITHMMPQCDYVVCCTPYTPDTHELVSAAAIAAMKPNAVLINVGRGKCVDEQALIQGTAVRQLCGLRKAQACDVSEAQTTARIERWSLCEAQ
jgi:phosphoglycerate dehydrogenase-like enzyme